MMWLGRLGQLSAARTGGEDGSSAAATPNARLNAAFPRMTSCP
jgi:hypothetical protein